MAYRKAGYSKKFFEGHREAITLHKAAKEAFEQLGLKKLPHVKELSAEYAQLLEQKKAAYPAYRKARAHKLSCLFPKEYSAGLDIRRNRHVPDAVGGLGRADIGPSLHHVHRLPDVDAGAVWFNVLGF